MYSYTMSPCKDCDKRCEGCHGKCKSYKHWKLKEKEYKNIEYLANVRMYHD